MSSSSAAVCSSYALAHEAMSPAPTRIAVVVGLAVRAAAPCLPSTVAVIVTDPGAHAVTTPRPFTFATPVSLDVQVVTRSPTGAPLASRGTAVRWIRAPTSRLADAGVTSTDETGVGGEGSWQEPSPESVNVRPAPRTNSQREPPSFRANC